jgi:hypothetical protein
METPTEKPRADNRWKWAVAAVVVVALLGLLSLFGFVFALLRNSDAARLAIAKAEESPALIERIGQPMQAGWLVTGNVESNPASGQAALVIPLSGPKGAGKLYVEAHKRAGQWQLDLLQFAPDGSAERLDLLPDEKATPQSDSPKP